MQMKNLKMSFFFQSPLFEKDEYTPSKTNFKRSTANMTIYKHKTNLINVTGIKSLEEVTTYRQLLEEEFKQPVIEERIDSMFFTHRNNIKIDLHQIYNWMREHRKDYLVDFNEETFHGMYLKPRDRRFPTIILFRTATYSLMGGKSLHLAYQSEDFVKDIVMKFRK